jgi:hypothetical protein
MNEDLGWKDRAGFRDERRGEGSSVMNAKLQIVEGAAGG